MAGNTQGRRNITGAQEGNASRRQPRSMSNSKGRSNQMRTEKHALWPLGDGQTLCKDRVQGEVGLPASAWNQSLNVRCSQPAELSQKPLPTKERVPSLSLLILRVCNKQNIFQPGLNCQFRTHLQGTQLSKGFLNGSASKESAYNAGDTGDMGLIPGWGRSPS